MIELPFRLDKPIAIGCGTLVMAAGYLYVWYLLKSKEGRTRAVVEFALCYIWHNISVEKRLSLFRRFLVGMAIFMGCFSLLGFSIGVGLLKNKEPEPIDYDALHRKMIKKHGLIKRDDPNLDKRREEYLKRRDANK